MSNEKRTKAYEVSVNFVLNVPKNTPDNATIYISGNHKVLGNWNPGKVALKKIAAFQYQISFSFPKGTHLEFKFTRGNWDTVERDKDVKERSNRKLIVKKGQSLNLQVLQWSDLGKIEKVKTHSWVGNIKVHNDFEATKLKNKRTVWVYLPPSYTKYNKKRYPVLYAHDGNNVFDKATAFLGVEWELDDTAEKLIREHQIRDVIIVAIENTPQRESEYTHTYVQGMGGGKADLYADFIINDIKPFIDKEYRTLKDRQYTGIMGSSLGGLVSMYIAWKYHHVFSMAGVISPSVWWDDRDIIRVIEKTEKKPPIKIWLDIGTKEGYEVDDTNIAVNDVRDLRNALIKKGFRLNHDLKYLEAKGARHDEASWANRVDKILLYFFGAKFRFFRRFFRI